MSRIEGTNNYPISAESLFQLGIRRDTLNRLVTHALSVPIPEQIQPELLQHFAGCQIIGLEENFPSFSFDPTTVYPKSAYDNVITAYAHTMSRAQVNKERKESPEFTIDVPVYPNYLVPLIHRTSNLAMLLAGAIGLEEIKSGEPIEELIIRIQSSAKIQFKENAGILSVQHSPYNNKDEMDLCRKVIDEDSHGFFLPAIEEFINGAVVSPTKLLPQKYKRLCEYIALMMYISVRSEQVKRILMRGISEDELPSPFHIEPHRKGAAALPLPVPW